MVLVFCQANFSASNLKKIFEQKEILTKELDTFKCVKQALEHLLRKTEYQQVRNITNLIVIVFIQRLYYFSKL